MAPQSSARSTTSASLATVANEKWVNVTWMNASTLSSTSHVCLSILSAHTEIDLLDHPLPIEWKVRISVYGIGGLPLTPLTCQTPTAQLRSITSRSDENAEDPKPAVKETTHACYWEYFIQMPVRWRDLPRDAYLLFEILGEEQKQLYQAAMPMFSRFGRLVTGLQRVDLSSKPLESEKNYGLVNLSCQDETDAEHLEDEVWRASCTIEKIKKLNKRTELEKVRDFQEILSVPWLDRTSIERAKSIVADVSLQEKQPLFEAADNVVSLIIELPTFDIPIVHEETFYPVPQQGASGAVAPLDLSIHRKLSIQEPSTDPNYFNPLDLVQIIEYENENDNPVEDKYRTLAHDLLRGLVDPALKPDREQRQRLADIIDSPSHHPTREERDLLWRFRFSLVDNRRALTKFLLAVDWTVESEVVQAAELLEQWRRRSPIEVTDALKLLDKNVAFQTNLVRSYAIDTLAQAPDDELRLYLLQLVQALKYENMELTDVSSPLQGNERNAVTQVSSLASFLINRAAQSVHLANFLYWYLKVELQNPTYGSRYREVFAALKNKLSSTAFHLTNSYDKKNPDDSAGAAFKSIVDSVSKLGTSFRQSEKAPFECLSKKFENVWDVLVAQDNFITGLLDIQLRCRELRGKKDAKEGQMKSLLSKEGFDKHQSRCMLPLPSAPEILVNGVNPETVRMFKSALYPALVEFHVEGIAKKDGYRSSNSAKDRQSSPMSPKIEDQTTTFTTYKVIVKTGDDLRQDQLIIMMIQLMDGLLKRAALDLCLTPYSVIALSPNSGLVEFVDGSLPISQILSENNGSILNFFQSVASQKDAKYEVRPEVMSTYIRSCAGYCVITYLLAVGDRHLDNILLRSSGHLFHIDFGFVFGRDPKPLPPAFRLTREMVDGMGGTESSEYRQFCSLACQAFNALRKSAGLILNLLHLMSDAGIEDLSNNPAGDADGVLAKVEERFRLDLNDEQADHFFSALINDSLAAIAPRVMDVFHSFSVARR